MIFIFDWNDFEENDLLLKDLYWFMMCKHLKFDRNHCKETLCLWLRDWDWDWDWILIWFLIVYSLLFILGQGCKEGNLLVLLISVYWMKVFVLDCYIRCEDVFVQGILMIKIGELVCNCFWWRCLYKYLHWIDWLYN